MLVGNPIVFNLGYQLPSSSAYTALPHHLDLDMEVLAAVGLAGSVVQFVDFLSRLISTGVETAGSAQGASQHTLELQKIYESLSDFSIKLSSGPSQPRSDHDDASSLRSSMADSREIGQSAELQAHFASLKELSADCNILCQTLLRTLRTLRVDGTSFRSLKGLKVALRTVWSGKSIKELEERISRYQRLIYMHFLPIMR